MAPALGRTLFLGIDSSKAQEGARSYEDAIRRVDSGSTKATTSVARAEAAFGRLERQLDPVAAATAKLERGTRTLEDALKRGSIGVERHADLMERLRQSTAAAEAQQSRLARLVQSFGSGLAAGFAAAGISTGIAELARGFVTAADAAGRMDSQLRVATGSIAGAHQAFTELYGIAARTGTPVEALVTLYSRVSGAAKDLGASQRDVLKLTEGVSNALKIGGQSASEASGALLQLGQALGSPTIQAEEFNSLLDGMRPLLQAVADHIEDAGGSVGRLTALVKEGRVSNDEFFRAAIAGADDLAKKAGAMDGTWSAALGRMSDATTRLVGDLDGLTGTTSVMKSAFEGVASTIDTLSTAVESLGGSIGAQVKALDALAAHQRDVIKENDQIEKWLRDNAGNWAGDLFGGTRWDRTRLEEFEAAAKTRRDALEKATAEAAAPAIPKPTGEIIKLAPKPTKTKASSSRSSGRDTSVRDYNSAESAYNRYEAEQRREETKALKEQEQAYSGLEQLRVRALELTGREVEALTMRRDIALKALDDEKLSITELAEARSLTAEIYDRQIFDVYDKQRAMAAGNVAAADSVSFLADGFKEIGVAATSSFEEAITAGGKLSDVLEGLAQDIEKILIRQTVTKPLSALLDKGIGALGGLAGSLFSGAGPNSGAPVNFTGAQWDAFVAGGMRSAHGNVFDRGNVLPFARGGIVNRPTLFPMARGMGLMGEAGPEAVLPLKRLASGNLGVQATAPAQSAPQVTINVVNNAGVGVEAQQERRSDGGLDINFLLTKLTEHVAAEAARPGTVMNRSLALAASPLRGR